MIPARLSLSVARVAIWSLLAGCAQKDGPPDSGMPDASPEAAPAEDAASADAASLADAASPEAAGPACPAWDGTSPPPATLSWTVTYPGGGDPPAGMCMVEESINGRCSGRAKVQKQGTGIMLVFPDGTTLRWDEGAGAPAIPPPSLSSGATVWVEWAWRGWRSLGFLVQYRRRLELRDRQGGPVRWAAQLGPGGGDADDDLIQDLFGVAAPPLVACQSRSGDGRSCGDSEYTHFAHALETTPPLTVPYRQRTRLAVPAGTYDVVWTADTREPIGPGFPQCSDRNEFPPDAIELAAIRVP
jgi:hypothetical protein